MKKVDIILWVFSVLVPITLLVVGLLMMKTKTPKPVLDADDTSVGQNLAPQTATRACSAEPVACSLADPQSCAGCGESVCTPVGANDTDYNVEGTFCLPPKPVSACTQAPADPNSRMQGKLRWTGWAGVNVQAWDCACPYPQYYPMDTSSGGVSGACKRSSALCRNGNWRYPCKRPEGDPTSCEALSPEESAALVGSDPLMNGLCSCDDVPCTGNQDCAGICVDGVCAGQRLSMNPRSGLPECVVDTCSATIKCNDTCPGGARCEGGVCQQSTSVCGVDADCGKAGTCADGRCSWGKWEVSPTPPYVFGKCACPDGSESTGAFCRTIP